ncbi:HAD family hydrolase [Streptacidiphilus cavernicola]|uniref:HAD family hydrolase n=1 Tax=Streptacidiphilus cavernicola TaxID=3342716 RepID=A0ABV6VXC8_9ACTN
MDRPSYDAVLCDLDGVIRFYDHTEVHALERAAGLPEGSTAEVAFAPEADLPLLLGRISRDDWVDAIARGLAGRTSAEQARALAQAFGYAPSWADAEAVALLRQARERTPVVLVTNATTWLDGDLALLGLDDLADAVVNSSRVGVAKPDPRIYRIAAAEAGVPPERCLFVDDNEANVEAARALGMTGVVHTDPSDLRRALAG